MTTIFSVGVSVSLFDVRAHCRCSDETWASVMCMQNGLPVLWGCVFVDARLGASPCTCSGGDLRIGESEELTQQSDVKSHVLYACLPYVFTEQFGKALAAVTTDVTAQRTLEATQMSFKPLLDLLPRTRRASVCRSATT